MKLQSKAIPTTTNDDDLSKEANGDPVEKDHEQPTADEPEIANDAVLEEHVKDSTPEKIIEVPMPGTNESIIINPEAFTSKESSFDVFDNESIVNGSRDDNSAQESKLTSGKSFLTDSSNRSLIDDSLEDHSFIPPGNQTAAESSTSGRK